MRHIKTIFKQTLDIFFNRMFNIDSFTLFTFDLKHLISNIFKKTKVYLSTLFNSLSIFVYKLTLF